MARPSGEKSARDVYYRGLKERQLLGGLSAMSRVTSPSSCKWRHVIGWIEKRGGI